MKMKSRKNYGIMFLLLSLLTIIITYILLENYSAELAFIVFMAITFGMVKGIYLQLYVSNGANHGS